MMKIMKMINDKWASRAAVDGISVWLQNTRDPIMKIIKVTNNKWAPRGAVSEIGRGSRISWNPIMKIMKIMNNESPSAGRPADFGQFGRSLVWFVEILGGPRRLGRPWGRTPHRPEKLIMKRHEKQWRIMKIVNNEAPRGRGRGVAPICRNPHYWPQKA